jgi:hypothetical protein
VCAGNVVEEDTRGVCRAHDHSLALCGACASCSHCVLLSHHRHPRTTDERRRDKTLFNVGGAVAAFVYEGGCRWPAPPVAGIHHYSRCRTAAHALHLTRMRSELSSRATQHAHRNADTAPPVRNEACTKYIGNCDDGVALLCAATLDPCGGSSNARAAQRTN